jgi:hypothetical protein
MKTTIKNSSKNKSKYDNVYFDITINGHLLRTLSVHKLGITFNFR